MAAPPVPTPADYFALTRILLVPSVWEEPFGRVAAEAMINGDSAARQRSWIAAAVVGGDFSAGRRRTRAADPRVDDGQDAARSRAKRRSSRGTTRSARSGTMPALYEARSRRERSRSPTSGTAKRCRGSKHVDYFTSLTPGADPLADRP